MQTREISIMKAGEKTSGGRYYTTQAIQNAMDKIKWNSKVPINAIDRKGDEKTVAFLSKADFNFDGRSGILSVSINDDASKFLMGRSLVPHVYVERVRKGKDDMALIDDFTLQGIKAVDDLCSFPSINSIVK